METPNRRRIVIVGDVQRRLLAAYALHLGLVVGLFLAALYVPSLLNLRNGGDTAGSREVVLLFQKTWPALGLVIIASLLHATIVTHRVAGPMVQIRRVLEEVREGHLDARVNIRRNDYLSAEAEAINEALDAMEGRVLAAEARARSAGSPTTVGL